MDENKALSDDELWDRAGQAGSISNDELGIQKSSSSDGLQNLNEGFTNLTFELNKGKNNKGSEQ